MAPDPITPDQRRSARVVLPSPTGPALHPVLACGSNACCHIVEPDPIGFAEGLLTAFVDRAEVLPFGTKLRF